jgi:hypothetical protein
MQGVFSLADNFKRASATGTGSLTAILTVASSDLSTTPPTQPATLILNNITVSNKTGGQVRAEVAINDSSASIETYVVDQDLANNTPLNLTTTQVLEQGDQIKVKGNGLKFSFNFMEMI